MFARVGGQVYQLKAGDSLLIWMHQAHSYYTEGHSKHQLCVFAPELVQRFFVAYTGYQPTTPLIPAESGTLIQWLMAQLKDEKNRFSCVGILYVLCGEIEKYATLEPQQKKEREVGADLLAQMLTYINDNYQNDCSLDTISRALRYEKTYLSKFFSRHIGITLSEYVLQLRLAHAGQLLLNGDTSVIEVGEASGFNSLRTFNRNFIDYYGMTPSQYRIEKGGTLRKKKGRTYLGAFDPNREEDE